MGYTSYSSASRGAYTEKASKMSTNELFRQNFDEEMHQTMNPFDMTVRECRDSAAHPKAFPIIIALDVTGSMGRIPETMIKDTLTHLMEGLLEFSGIDPSICFMAVGDQYSDDAPLQVGQFESGDNEMATWFERTWLEGRGGGGGNESYSLVWYAANKYVQTDAWDKRKQKGIIITMGDEMTHPYIDDSTTKKVFNRPEQFNMPIKEVLEIAQQRWEIYHLHIDDGNYPASRSDHFAWWQKLMGEKAVLVQHSNAIAQTIVDIVKHSEVTTPSEIKGTSVMEIEETPDKEEPTTML